MNSTWVDFRTVKEQVSFDQVLALYGITWLKDKGDTLVGKCPLHGGVHNSQSFHISRAKGAWKCFGDCRAGGNLLDFVARKEQVTVREAAELLAERFGIPRAVAPSHEDGAAVAPHATRKAAGAPQTRRKPKAAASRTINGEHASTAHVGANNGNVMPSAEATSAAVADDSAPPPTRAIFPDTAAVNPPLTFCLKGLDPTHPYLRQRVDEAAIAHFGLGYCTKGLMAGRIAIPIHDARGRLVAYAGRAVDDQVAQADGKYRLPQGFKKSHVLFNLDRAAELARADGLVVVEGFFGALHLHQAGVANVVAVMGSTLSPEQEELLLLAVGGPTGKVALMLDRDEAGHTSTKALLAALITKVHVRVVPYPTPQAIQPDHLTVAQVRTAVFGNPAPP